MYEKKHHLQIELYDLRILYRRCYTHFSEHFQEVRRFEENISYEQMFFGTWLCKEENNLVNFCSTKKTYIIIHTTTLTNIFFWFGGSSTEDTKISKQEDYWTSICQVYTSHMNYEHYFHCPCIRWRIFPRLILLSFCILNTHYLLVGYCWTSQKWIKQIMKKMKNLNYYHKVLDWLLGNWLSNQYNYSKLSLGKGEWRGCLGGEAINNLQYLSKIANH